MATQETRTDQIEAAGVGSAEERKSAKRFAAIGWWARRYRELSWAWRFNLAILVLAVLNAATIQIADAFGHGSVSAICRAIYSVVVAIWFVGAVFTILVTFKRFFTPSRTQPPTDAGNHPGYDKVQ